jgi:hypothetical protein
LGVDRIETVAARGPEGNGYYTWPRFGYDASLDLASTVDYKAVESALPQSLKGAARVSDLMATEEGRAWWKANGDTIHMTFDLQEGSLSRRVWEAYKAEKANK